MSKVQTIISQADVYSKVGIVVEGRRQLPHQHIFTLQIAVNDMLSVQIFNSFCNLPKKKRVGLGLIINNYNMF